jgi:hypothetical protein
MKFFAYTLSTVALSLVLTAIANPVAAFACTKIIGNG